MSDNLPDRVRMLMGEAASAITETYNTVTEPFPDGFVADLPPTNQRGCARAV
jgi:hypothetical protein